MLLNTIESLKNEINTLQEKYFQILRTNRKLNEKLLELYLLYKISLTLSTSVDLQQVLKAIKEIFQTSFNVDQFSIMLFDEHDEKLFVRSSFGIPKEEVAFANFPEAKYIFFKAIHRAQPIYINDISKQAQYDYHPGKRSQQGAFVSMPLLSANKQPFGVLNLQRSQINSFTKSELKLLERITEQIARVIDRTLLFSYTKALSITDELTKIYNRRYFNQRYEREIIRAKRYGRTLTIMMFDIDYFKHYNDTHGHLMGDEVLAKVAHLLDSNIRQADILARYGGEEFVLILPEIDQEQALQAAEKLRGIIEDYHFPGEEKQPNGKVSISVGLATFPGDAGDSHTLLDLADQALYTAKASGRNAVGYCLDPAKCTFKVYKPKPIPLVETDNYSKPLASLQIAASAG